MKAERAPNQQPDSAAAADPYAAAEAELMRRVEALQETGEMRRPSLIETVEEQDEHFDDLSRLYRQVCVEMGLPWPPPPLDALDGQQDEGELQEDNDPDPEGPVTRST